MALRLAQLSEILPPGRRSFEVRRASVISQPPWLPEDSGALDPPKAGARQRAARCAFPGDRRPPYQQRGAIAKMLRRAVMNRVSTGVR